MSDHMHSGMLDERWSLKEVADALCAKPDGDFVRKLAFSSTRWSSVAELLSAADLTELERVAFAQSFSPCNLKAHYVLDEDFIDGGTALVVFALVGSAWTHVVRLKGQSAIVPPEAWMNGEGQ